MKKINNIEKDIDSIELPLDGNLYLKNKRRISFAKLFRLILISTTSVFIIIFLLTSFVTLYLNKTKAEILTQDDVVSSLKKIIILPKDTDPISINRVSDAETLKKQDPFYENVDNGDYLIQYDKMSIIFDYQHNLIKNVLSKR